MNYNNYQKKKTQKPIGINYALQFLQVLFWFYLLHCFLLDFNAWLSTHYQDINDFMPHELFLLILLREYRNYIITSQLRMTQ